MVGSIFSGTAALLVHKELSHRERLSAKWALAGKQALNVGEHPTTRAISNSFFYVYHPRISLDMIRKGRSGSSCVMEKCKRECEYGKSKIALSPWPKWKLKESV